MRIAILALVLIGVGNASASSVSADETSLCTVKSIENVTLIVNCFGVVHKMNFAYIRFPLEGQRHFEESRIALKNNLVGKSISAKKMKDFKKYPDKSMYMFYFKGKNINSGLVQLGHAWVDLYQTKSANFLNKESYAAASRSGLWKYKKSERVHPNIEENKRAKDKKMRELRKSMTEVIRDRFDSIYIVDSEKRIAYPANCFEVQSIPYSQREIVTSLVKLEKENISLITESCTRIGQFVNIE